MRGAKNAIIALTLATDDTVARYRRDRDRGIGKPQPAEGIVDRDRERVADRGIFGARRTGRLDAVDERGALRREQLDAAIGGACLVAGGSETGWNDKRRTAAKLKRQHGALRRVGQGPRRAIVRAARDEHAILVEDAAGLGQRGELRLVVDRSARVKETYLRDSAGPRDSNRFYLADDQRRLIGHGCRYRRQDEE